MIMVAPLRKILDPSSTVMQGSIMCPHKLPNKLKGNGCKILDIQSNTLTNGDNAISIDKRKNIKYKISIRIVSGVGEFTER